MRAWIGFVVVAFLLSGCTGAVKEDPGVDPTASAEPTPSSTVETTYRENESLGAKGAIEGLVHDDYAFIIQGAHVILAGTSFFADTDARGKFSFVNLSVKTYHLRVDHKDFLSYEADVEVQAGRVAALDITLVRPVDPNATMSVPHKHDWWGDDREVVIMDRDLVLPPGCGVQVVVTLNPGTMCEYRVWLRSSEDPNERPNVVLQGTGKLTVKVSVNQLPYPVDLFVKRPGVQVQQKATTIRSSPTTWETPVLENQTDPSHFRKSSWEFWITANKDTGGQSLMAFVGPMHLTVTITRSDREIPVEPPHPDRWGSLKERVLFEKKACRYERTPASTTTYSGCGEQTLPKGETVTVGTGRMKITLNWKNQHPVPNKFAIEYVGADQTGDAYNTEWARPAPTKDGADSREFEFNVRSELWDSPYSDVSLWKFRWVLLNEPGSSVELFQGTLDLKVEIFKDAK